MNEIEQRDKDIKLYVDMKIRALKKVLAPFIWMGKNPGKAAFIILLILGLFSLLFEAIDIRGTIENIFNIELK